MRVKTIDLKLKYIGIGLLTAIASVLLMQIALEYSNKAYFIIDRITSLMCIVCGVLCVRLYKKDKLNRIKTQRSEIMTGTGR